MPLSLKEINRQRELMNYEYPRLYNLARYRTGKVLQDRKIRIKEVKSGADPSEYGVIFTDPRGNKTVRKFSTFETCLREAARFNGEVVRLGGLTPKAFDAYSFSQEEKDKSGYFVDWDTGLVEFVEKEIKGNQDYNSVIALALEEMGYPKAEAIQYTSTRPTAEDLLKLHKRHPDVSVEDFAAAVLNHCEIPTPKRKSVNHNANDFKSAQEKKDWYSTPAGIAWTRHNPVPPIMTHIKEEYFEWKTKAQSDK